MFNSLKSKIMYKLAEISPIFEKKHMALISALIFSLVSAVLYFCNFQPKVIVILGIFSSILMLFFTYKRASFFVDFSVYIEIIQSNKGSVLEVGVVGFNNKGKYCTLSLNRFETLCDINNKLLEQHILENYSAKYSPDLNVIYLMDTDFKSFDQANIVKQHLLEILKLYISRNLRELSNGLRYAAYDKKEIKKYSRLFGLFFLFTKKHS